MINAHNQSEYQELRRQCQDFATALLDHTRTSNELEVMLNHDPTGPVFEHGERMHLNRLKLAIKLRQKKVCAHIFSNIYSHELISTKAEHLSYNGQYAFSNALFALSIKNLIFFIQSHAWE